MQAHLNRTQKEAHFHCFDAKGLIAQQEENNQKLRNLLGSGKLENEEKVKQVHLNNHASEVLRSLVQSENTTTQDIKAALFLLRNHVKRQVHVLSKIKGM